MKCGECAHYAAQVVPVRRKGVPAKELPHGHCLKRTIYAANSRSKEPLPPGAKSEERPFGQHSIYVVYAAAVEANCPFTTKKK